MPRAEYPVKRRLWFPFGNARAIDFAKFGRLFLRKGNWEGTQVIPASWVEESTEEDTALNREAYYQKKGLLGALKNGYYKYMWWGISPGGGQFDFFAMGNHGQFIYVAPRKNLIVVRNGETSGKGGASGLQPSAPLPMSFRGFRP